MDQQLVINCALTFSIHLIGALAYSARIAGVRTGRIAGARTGRIAVSFDLFNILVLVSSLSDSFLGPFLAKRIKNGLARDTGEGQSADVSSNHYLAVAQSGRGASGPGAASAVGTARRLHCGRFLTAIPRR